MSAKIAFMFTKSKMGCKYKCGRSPVETLNSTVASLNADDRSRHRSSSDPEAHKRMVAGCSKCVNCMLQGDRSLVAPKPIF